MRTTLSIDDTILERAKAKAAERRQTLGAYVEEALRSDLAAPRQPAVVVHLPVARGGTPRPGIDLKSNSSLYAVLDEEDMTS